MVWGPRAAGLRRWLVVLALVTATSSAHAQARVDGFGIERFRPAMDGAGLLDVDWADVPGHGSWGVGMWLGFAHDPLVIYDRQMTALDSAVGARLTTGLVGTVALWNRLELGAGLDFVGYQSGDPSALMTALPTSGVGDLRAMAKLFLGRGAGVQVALIPIVTIPMGSARGFLREAGPLFAPELAIAGSRDRFRGAVNLGYRIRKRVDAAGLIVDDEVYLRAALGVLLGPARAPLAELAVSGSLAAPAGDRQANQIAVELMAGGSRRVAGSIGVFVAGGLGLDNGFGTPDWRAVAGVRFDSARGDRDGDGLEGVADRCPELAEDVDRFEDRDGCPDPDNDGDQIADASDRCPDRSEDRDGHEDGDGCPDLDDDKDGIVDAEDRCPAEAEDHDGVLDVDGCVDAEATLDGRVVDLDGRPIPRAVVRIAQPNRLKAAPIQITSGEDGRFTAAVDGAARVAVEAPEYKPEALEVVTTPGKTSEVVIKMARAIRQGQLRGQVQSFGGKPLAATIAVTGKTTATATTDASGQFAVDLPAGSFTVVIESAGYLTQRRTVSVKLDGVTVLNIDMRRTP